MYRDDQCAVCGDSLPPDHLYCREHASTVDDRLHEIATLLARLSHDVPTLATLLTQIAPDTYDWLAERAGVDEDWPPVPALTLRMAPEEVVVQVDPEPGMVHVSLNPALAALLETLGQALHTPQTTSFIDSCSDVEGANATH